MRRRGMILMVVGMALGALAVGALLVTTIAPETTTAPGLVPVAATGVTSKVMFFPLSAGTSVYAVDVAPAIATPSRNQRYVEVPSISASMSE